MLSHFDSCHLHTVLDLSLRVWNYEEPALLNSFDNHDFPDKGISKLCLLNELDDSLLLVASGKSLNFFVFLCMQYKVVTFFF